MVTEILRLTCDSILSHQLVACCHSYCGLPVRGKDMMIYNNVDTESKPLLLTGHHGQITAMTFGKGRSPVLLCSASSDYVIVWDIEHCQRRIREGKLATGTVIGTLLGKITHLSFCFSDERVAACSGTTLYILSHRDHAVVSTLTGHLRPITAAEFCPWNKDVLVTISEDRTFKVWDFKNEVVCYDSLVLSVSPLVSMLFLEENRYLIAGSTAGQVWCFSLHDDLKCHLVTKMDLEKLEKRYKGQSGSLSQQTGNTEPTAVGKVEISKPVLKIASCCLCNDAFNEQKRDNSWLCIGSTDGLYVIDLATSELQTVIYFTDYPNLSITMAGSWSVSGGRSNSVLAFVGSLFTPCLALLEFSLGDLGRLWVSDDSFSVFASYPPVPESPLNAEFREKNVIQHKKKGLMDQPLVFHPKVKSSGYNKAPRRTLFVPKTNTEKKSSEKRANRNIDLFHRNPPDAAAAAVPTVPYVDVSTGNKPVCCLQYSGDGKHILCGLGDSLVLLYRCSLAGSPTVYTGHDKPVSSVSWSLNRHWWLSASEDSCLRVWTHSRAEPAIIMDKSNFPKPIRSTQFYYLDKFILLASGPSMHLYLYKVDTSPDDIKRYKKQGIVKLAGSFESTSATNITALSSVNDFFSYIVLMCGLDRSIQVFDMNKGAVAAVLPDAHSRAIHCISQNTGSMFSTQAPDSYNLFLSSAVTDGVKIWDLRTLRCTRRYENHVNRCHPCSAAISPCGRFIATGSEDNCAYVYDIRSSSYLHKLQNFSDTVLNVGFNPASTQLLTGTLDGKLRLFQPSSGALLSQDAGAAVH